jgi:hypothetical protein
MVTALFMACLRCWRGRSNVNFALCPRRFVVVRRSADVWNRYARDLPLMRFPSLSTALGQLSVDFQARQVLTVFRPFLASSFATSSDWSGV